MNVTILIDSYALYNSVVGKFVESLSASALQQDDRHIEYMVQCLLKNLARHGRVSSIY